MPIMWGLAIGAAMGGGIAALRGGKTEDILKGAVMGGATGALGGGISSLASAGTAGAVGSGVANVAPGAGASILENAGTSAISPALAGQSSSMTSLFPNAAGSLSGVATGAPTIANTALNQGIASQAASTAGTGFFGSGIGKTIADNKGMLGAGALGLLALNKPNSSSQNDQQTDSYIRPYEFSQVENPDYQGAGTPYFKQSYTAKAPIKASEFGATTVANGGAIRMAEGGEVPTTQEQRENRTNPTLEALAVMQQAQQTYQPPAPAVSQGITQPFIQPQMAAIQQQYAAPQRQAPAAFQYQAPTFTKYGIDSLSGGSGSGGSGELIDPTTKQPVKSAAQIIAAKKPAGSGVSGGSSGVFDTYGNEMGPKDIYSGPGYYERYPVAEVYDYTNELPTRPFNPNEGSPEFNVPSNFPVDPSSGLSAIQQQYANMGYTDYIPSANVDYGGNTGANGGLVYNYAMGGGIGSYYPEPDDGDRQLGVAGLNQGPQYPMQGIGYAMGGHLGGYSDGGQLLKGPGDGVSDDIPAQIGNRQPARLADGEFVVPARIVSELGNGSTDAGAKRLYAMMDRVQANRKKTVGKGKVAVNSKSDKYLPA